MIYVIQTVPEAEMSVRANLEGKGIAAYVPRRSLIIRKSAGWTKIINILFPCYVFLECDYSAELHHRVKAVDNVIRFLGDPTPIKAADEDFMRLLFNGGEIIPESTAHVDADRKVTVTGGWLLGKEQYVTYYNIRQQKAALEISFGGRKRRANVGVIYSK